MREAKGRMCGTEVTECTKAKRQKSRHRVEEPKDVQCGRVVGWADRHTKNHSRTGNRGGDTFSLHANLRSLNFTEEVWEATTDQIADTD